MAYLSSDDYVSLHAATVSLTTSFLSRRTKGSTLSFSAQIDIKNIIKYSGWTPYQIQWLNPFSVEEVEWYYMEKMKTAATEEFEKEEYFFSFKEVAKKPSRSHSY